VIRDTHADLPPAAQREPGQSSAAVRVLLLGPLPPPFGGPEVMTRALLAGLQSSRRLIVRHVDTQVSRSLAEKGGRQQQVRKALAGLAQALRVLLLIIRFRPAIVYLPLTNSPYFAGFLRDSLFILPALALGRKVAVRLHGGYYFYAHTSGLRQAFVRALLSRVSLAMVQGARLQAEFNGLIHPARIVVVPNGVDDQPFLAARQRAAARPRPEAPRQVLFVGILVPEKGVRDVVAAIPLVPGAVFVFAGEWPSAADEEEVRAALDVHGVTDRAVFKGVVTGDAKYDLFLSSHIFLFPSYFVYEGHSVSTVEALAAGLPIVCTDHGALNESVRDGWNGYFVPRSDPQSIARQLNMLLEDDVMRKQMGERSRQLYEQRFTLEQFVDAWERAIESVAGQAGGRAV
jgi:glycosyltransferase involved in cell wall biosynthesis